MLDPQEIDDMAHYLKKTRLVNKHTRGKGLYVYEKACLCLT